jgi:excisionase family DNA binding protein
MLEKFIYSVPEVAAGFGCCERFVWKEIHAGRLGHTRMGRRVGVTKEQIGAYLHRNSNGASLAGGANEVSNIGVKADGIAQVFGDKHHEWEKENVPS